MPPPANPNILQVTESYDSGDSYTGSVKRIFASSPESKPSSPTQQHQSDDFPSPPSPTNKATATIKHGYGRYTFADGSYYAGEWSNGSMEGKGVFYEAATKDQFDGVWRDGKRVQGVYKYGANGDMYIGGFDVEAGSKKTGPALVLDDCILYKALYAEDRLIRRDLILMPVHKDWSTLVGGLAAAHASNPGAYQARVGDNALYRAGSPTPGRGAAAGNRSPSPASRANNTTTAAANRSANINSSVVTHATPRTTLSPSRQQLTRALSPTAAGASGGARGATSPSRSLNTSNASARSNGGRIITTSYKAPHVLLSPHGSMRGGGAMSNPHRANIANNSGRLLGAGSVTVGIAPNLKTTERCESPPRQQHFADVYATHSLHAGNGGQPIHQYSNNTYYEDVAKADHPIGHQLLVAELRREAAEEGGGDESAMYHQQMSTFSSGSIPANHHDADDNNPAHRASSKSALKSSSSYAAATPADDGEPHRSSSPATSSSKQHRSVTVNVDAAEGAAAAGSGANPTGTSALTQEEALDAARAVLRQRRNQIEAGSNGTPQRRAGSPQQQNASATAILLQQRQQQQQPLPGNRMAVADFVAGSPSISRHNTQMSMMSGGGADNSPVPFGNHTNSNNNNAAFGSFHESFSSNANGYRATSPQMFLRSGSASIAGGRPSSSQFGDMGTLSPTQYAMVPVVGGTKVADRPQLLTKNGSIVMAPPNARSVTCRTLSASAFGNIQRGRVEHVDDVSTKELTQAYRYFNKTNPK